MYDAKTGEVLCDVCGEPIGNINGDDNFFALIRKKYCDKHRDDAYHFYHREAQRAYRKRKKREKKLLVERLDLLAQENELLRQRLKEERENR